MNPEQEIMDAFEFFIKLETNMFIIRKDGFYYGATLLRYEMFKAGYLAAEKGKP